MASTGKSKQSKKKAPAKAAKPKSEDKLALLVSLAATINKNLGVAGKVFVGTDAIEWVRRRTGIAALDFVLGGGLVEGQMVQFTGGESSAKTTAALISIATIQRDDPSAIALWVAGEGFDRGWARLWGVDLNRLYVIQTTTGHVGLEAAVSLIESGAVTVAVFDSIQSLGTEREMEGGVDSESYAGAGAPQLWGRVTRRIYAAVAQPNVRTCMIAISQLRSKIGGHTKPGMPPPTQGSQIYALKHWKAADVEFSRSDIVAVGEEEHIEVKARRFKLKTSKNKTASPGRISSFWMAFTDGIPWVDNAATLVKLGIRYGFIEKTGAWYRGCGIAKTNGLDAFKDKLAADSEAVELLQADLEDVYAQG